MSEDRLADLAAAIPNEGERDADTTGDDEPLNVSRSPLPPEQRSPIHMDGIPEIREDVPRLSRNTSPCLATSTQHEQLQNDSFTTVVSNDQVSTSLVNDNNIVYNKQNEYAV